MTTTIEIHHLDSGLADVTVHPTEDGGARVTLARSDDTKQPYTIVLSLSRAGLSRLLVSLGQVSHSTSSGGQKIPLAITASTVTG